MEWVPAVGVGEKQRDGLGPCSGGGGEAEKWAGSLGRGSRGMGRSLQTSILVVLESQRPSLFWDQFVDWHKQHLPSGYV